MRHPPRASSAVARACGIALTVLTANLALSAVVEDPASAVAPGSVRGRVELKQAPADAEPRPNPADLGMHAAHGATDRRRSVVYLDPAPRAAFDVRDDVHARIDQRNEAFVPHVLAIIAGTSVDFPNNDHTYHNVFSLSKPTSFDLGRYAAGRSKSVRFDQPGIVRVFCDIHSHMSAFILVFSHRYFAVTDEDGRYRIDNVPPGTYTVVAWNEAMPTETRRVTVGDGAEADLTFSLSKKQP
ncbi:MAG: carboxypeptidase regulatory-like domain-containing protein [Vicinamibacterales bacterium]